MIYINHKDFEKLSTVNVNLIRKLIGESISPVEKRIVENRLTTKARNDIENNIYGKKKKKLYKKASINKLPKVNKSGIKRAKKITLDEGESHSLIRAIERSKSPKKVIKEVNKSTEPIYAGGNTSANMRGVVRSENKKMNEINKEKYDRTAKGYLSRTKGRL